MPLSDTQKGAIGQFAFFATAIGTANGELEAYAPIADNEGRDGQIRRHIMPLPGFSVQIKVVDTLTTTKPHGARYLHIGFEIALDRLKNDPLLWYFFGYYPAEELRLHDPAFLVRSDILYKLARVGKPTKGRVWFLMHASVEPDSRDKWRPYRVSPKDLGRRLLQIVDEAGLTMSGDALQPLPGSVWLVRSTAGSHPTKVRAGTKYDRIRSAVLNRQNVSGWYEGHHRVFSPFLLGTKTGEPHVLGYQFDGTSEKPLGPDGSPENWRCLRLAELTRVTVVPGVWHEPRKGKGFQTCIDQIDVSAYPLASVRRRLRPAA